MRTLHGALLLLGLWPDFLTGTPGPLYAEAFASDVLGARLLGTEVALDAQHLLLGQPKQRGRYTLALSAVHDWGVTGGRASPVTLAPTGPVRAPAS